MNRPRSFAFVIAAITGVSLGAVAQADEPLQEIPELKMLSHWVGTYDSELLAPTIMKGSSTGTWVLGGRYMRQEWNILPTDTTPAIYGSALMTYDTEAKVYRQWSFQSTDGTVTESEGKWDAAKQTMTWNSKPRKDGTVMITKAHFTAEQHEEWKITIKDGSGHVVFEMNGKNTPKAK